MLKSEIFCSILIEVLVFGSLVVTVVHGVSDEIKPIKYPDTTRTGTEITEYRNEILKKLNKTSLDTTLIFTGESCARGLGNLYRV